MKPHTIVYIPGCWFIMFYTAKQFTLCTLVCSIFSFDCFVKRHTRVSKREGQCFRSDLHWHVQLVSMDDLLLATLDPFPIIFRRLPLHH